MSADRDSPCRLLETNAAKGLCRWENLREGHILTFCENYFCQQTKKHLL